MNKVLPLINHGGLLAADSPPAAASPIFANFLRFFSSSMICSRADIFRLLGVSSFEDSFFLSLFGNGSLKTFFRSVDFPSSWIKKNIRMYKIIWIPGSSNTNIQYQFFDYKITFMNSQHAHIFQSLYYTEKILILIQVLKISDTKIRLRFGKTNLINIHLWLKNSQHESRIQS